MLLFIKTPESITPKQSEIAKIIEECAEEMNVRIDYECQEKIAYDGAYFFRLIHNLVNNAARAGADHITIAIWKAGSFAVMDISDNGPANG